MRSLQETFEIIQRDINNIKDPAARTKAQEKFDAMPKDPKKWSLDYGSLANINFKQLGLDATSC